MQLRSMYVWIERERERERERGRERERERERERASAGGREGGRERERESETDEIGTIQRRLARPLSKDVCLSAHCLGEINLALAAL